MKLSHILDHLEQLAPPVLQESYDNAGLLTGNRDMEISGVLVALDCIESIIDEAISKKCNLVVAHHPVIFSGLKKINGSNYVERTVIRAIKNDIAIYAIHTNLDNVQEGVNAKIAVLLGLTESRVLVPKTGLLRKLVAFCPAENAEAIRVALFAAGAGHIGNYDECSFNINGTGTFRGNDSTDPYIGEKGKRFEGPEVSIEMIYAAHLEPGILKALREAHPYEEIAFGLYPVINSWSQVGSGMVGKLPKPMAVDDFLNHLKSSMKAKVIRYTPVSGKVISKVAVCGGSGSFLLQDAIRSGADAFVSADFKYHQFFDADGKIVIADIGHFESEQFTMDLLVDKLKQKFPTFAVRQTEINTNPITYHT